METRGTERLRNSRLIMRFTPVFPLQKPISYLPQSKSAQIGRPPDEEAISCSHYDDVQQPLWEKLAEERMRMNQARRKFSTMTTIEIKKKWQKWDEATIDSYRLQFRVIDINEDGLIDFHELCQALDDIGDTSSMAERKRYFKEVDVDESDGVDFEEYLELLDRMQQDSSVSTSSGLEKVCATGTTEVKGISQLLGQLTLKKKIQYGLF